MPDTTLKGFSTRDYYSKKSFRIFEDDVIATNIQDFIFTIPGERVHLPEYGTEIPLLVFKPIDAATIKIITDGIKKAVQWYSDRVALIDLAVVEQNHGFVVVIDLENLTTKSTFTIRANVGT